MQWCEPDKSMHSSQCIWSPLTNASKLVGSLQPIHKYTLISSGQQLTPPSSSCRRSAITLEEASKSELAISVPRNDSHDTFLVKNSKVYLLLTPESFAAFGLDGSRIQIGSPAITRYLAVYDLKQPGKRLERLKWAFENTITQKYEFWFTTSNVSSDSTVSSKVVDIGVPNLRTPSDGAFQDWANAVIEWIGLCVLNPNLLARNSAPDPVLCAFYPYDDVNYQPVAVTHASGLFSSEYMEKLWSEVDSEWAVLHVEGFASSPVAWSRESVHSGELGYTLVKCGNDVSVFKYI